MTSVNLGLTFVKSERHGRNRGGAAALRASQTIAPSSIPSDAEAARSCQRRVLTPRHLGNDMTLELVGEAPPTLDLTNLTLAVADKRNLALAAHIP